MMVDTVSIENRFRIRIVSEREDLAPDRFDEEYDENESDGRDKDDRKGDRDEEKFIREAVAAAVRSVELVQNLELRVDSRDQ